MASLSVPKVTLGRSGYKKEKINLSHDVSTSTDWGFVQPLMCLKMLANSTLHLNGLRSVVRVSPLVKPTFGSASWKTYHRFIPLADLYPPYEYYLKGEPYFVASQAVNYVPTQMPWAYVMDISRILLGLNNFYTIYYKDSSVWKNIQPLATNVRTGIISGFIDNFVLSNGQESGISDVNCMLTDTESMVTPDSADYIVYNTLTVSNISYDIMVCFRLTRSNRNVRKILLGLGYQIEPNLKREVCILPIMAYYRCWFDLFAPKRDLGWTATNAYNILDYCKENNVTNVVANSYVRVKFKQLFTDMKSCFYTDDPDFISSHIPTPSVGMAVTAHQSVNSYTGTGSFSVLSNVNQQPYYAITANSLTSNVVKALDRMTKSVNKDSQIVHRLNDWLIVHGFGNSLTDIDPYKVGSDSVPINIESVMSTAETSEAGLGDFAGTAVGYKSNDKYPDFHFDAKNPGYFITLACCVPDAGWFQGLAPNTGVLDFRRYDEYFPEFDALGFQVSNKDQVVANGEVVDLVKAGSDPVSMGLIPRYTDKKVFQNTVNGDLSIRSCRTDCLPYTLDRFITPTSVQAEITSGEGVTAQWSVNKTTTTVPVASVEYRYIGKDAFMGNFDRIFQQYDALLSKSARRNFEKVPYPDHFIVHNFFDMQYMAPVLSMKDSYDTDSFDSNTMDVEKG